MRLEQLRFILCGFVVMMIILIIHRDNVLDKRLPPRFWSTATAMRSDATNDPKPINWMGELGRHLDGMALVDVVPNVNMTRNKVFCWVNTFEKNHEERAMGIKATCGKKCDKLVFFSNRANTTLPSVRVVAPPTHEALWKKHRAVLRIIYREYYGEYEWFFKVDGCADCGTGRRGGIRCCG